MHWLTSARNTRMIRGITSRTSRWYHSGVPPTAWMICIRNIFLLSGCWSVFTVSGDLCRSTNRAEENRASQTTTQQKGNHGNATLLCMCGLWNTNSPCKHATLNQCWFNVCQASTTLVCLLTWGAFTINPYPAKVIYLNFHPRSCVSLTRPTSSSGWKIFRFGKTEVNDFDILFIYLTR